MRNKHIVKIKLDTVVNNETVDTIQCTACKLNWNVTTKRTKSWYS